MSWFKCWDSFLNNATCEPPGPIDNFKLLDKIGVKTLGECCVVFNMIDVVCSYCRVICLETDYVSVSDTQWDYLRGIYNGGPAIETSELQMP